MKFYRFAPDSSIALYEGMDAAMRASLSLWGEAYWTVTTPLAAATAPFTAARPAPNAGEGATIPANIAGGKSLLLNIRAVRGYVVARAGNVTHTFAAGVHEVEIPAGQTLQLFARDADMTGLVLAAPIGEFAIFHSAKGRTQSRPTITTGVTRKYNVISYDAAARIEVRFVGAEKEDVELIHDLRREGRFWLWASGGRSGADAEWAYEDKLLACRVGVWDGFNGDSGRAVGGAFGNVEFVEVSKTDDAPPAAGGQPDAPQFSVQVSVDGKQQGVASGAADKEFAFRGIQLETAKDLKIVIAPARGATAISVNGVAAIDLFAIAPAGVYTLVNEVKTGGIVDIIVEL